MILLIYDFFTIVMVRYDINSYRRQMTPLAVFSLVNLFLINLNNIFLSKVYSFFLISNDVLYVFLLFNIVVFLIDYFFSRLYKSAYKIDYTFSIKFRNFKICLILFLIGVFAYALNFYRMFSIYGMNVKGKNNGILGHLSSLSFVLAPVVLDLAIKTNNKLRIAYTVILNLIVIGISVLFGGKYGVFINITYFILYFLLKRETKFDFSKIAKIVLLLGGFSLFVFVILYYVIPNITGQYNSSLDFAVEHMFYYLLSPVIANNYCVIHMNEGNPLFPFAVVINIFRAITGNHSYVNPINPFIFSYSYHGSTNVAGMIGELLYNIGLGWGLLYFIGFIIFINYLYLKYRTKNKFYLSMCYATSILAFSFFGNFMGVSGVVLPLLLAFGLDLFSDCRIGQFHI